MSRAMHQPLRRAMQQPEMCNGTPCSCQCQCQWNSFRKNRAKKGRMLVVGGRWLHRCYHFLPRHCRSIYALVARRSGGAASPV